MGGGGWVDKQPRRISPSWSLKRDKGLKKESLDGWAVDLQPKETTYIDHAARHSFERQSRSAQCSRSFRESDNVALTNLDFLGRCCGQRMTI